MVLLGRYQAFDVGASVTKVVADFIDQLGRSGFVQVDRALQSAFAGNHSLGHVNARTDLIEQFSCAAQLAIVQRGGGAGLSDFP